MKAEYNPPPLDATQTPLPPELTEITELLAENTHKVWARQRLAEGWRYGNKRDDDRKEHPCLVPYDKLPENEKVYDRNTALSAIRFVLANGYEIRRAPQQRPFCRMAVDLQYAVVTDEGQSDAHLPEGDYPILWTSNKKLPDVSLFSVIANRCVLLLDADTLRKSGAMISRCVSWERTATELVWQIQNNPALWYLNKSPHIVVTFAEDGAAYINCAAGEQGRTLALAHGRPEGFLREKTGLKPDDAFAAMTDALTRQLVDVMTGKASLRLLSILKAADSDTASDAPENVFQIPFSHKQGEIDPDYWCISNNVDNRRIFDLALEYAQKGSKVIDGVPQLSFGKLTTIDRQEIEAYQNIRNLIDNYSRSDSVRPLSIAVFGAPGSGKSFGVTEIANNVLPGKVERIEFNVSQFTDNADLGYAFQKVRDKILAGKLPLVFFDEFDSDRLRWLKSFLMPMQDGEFKDESGKHPLGKCILVFAGGTSATFEDFANPSSDRQKEFKDVKGPDFISRLRGTINVLGPNPASDSDQNYILRRALLLRSLCERKLKMKKDDDAPVNIDVLWAMLLVPKYKHGARSMEAIIDMSRIEGRTWNPVSLPFYSQLSLHVDADIFTKLVLREVILNSYIEKLAIAIHEDYRKNNPDTEYDIPWEALTEHIKDTNRDQAKMIRHFLTQVDCGFDLGDTLYYSIKQFDADEILVIARESHEAWLESKKAAGWKYGPVKDPVLKTHPCIVEWEELPEAEKQKDRDIAANIIPMMESVGLRVYKIF